MSRSKRLIVISGGSRGIGKAIAENFAAKGLNIATFSRNRSDLKKVKKELEQKYNVEVYVETVEINKKKQVRSFARKVMEMDYTIEVLVNNAGFFAPGQVSNEEDGVLEKTMEANVYGSYYLTREFLPVFMKNKSGHIFNICSTASIYAYINGGSYCMSKYAMLGFSRVLREELKEYAVRVTAVLPGATFTKSWESAGIPESRFMKPGDVADSVLAAWELPTSAVVEEVLIRPQLGDI